MHLQQHAVPGKRYCKAPRIVTFLYPSSRSLFITGAVTELLSHTATKESEDLRRQWTETPLLLAHAAQKRVTGQDLYGETI